MILRLLNEFRSELAAKNVRLSAIEEELNALGKDGWELVAAVSEPKAVQFYLKRIRQ